MDKIICSMYNEQMSERREKTSDKITLYYDGLCRLCSREISHYQKCAGSQSINFVDITTPGFSAEAHALDPYLVNKYLHVRKRDGSVVTGLDSFLAIWNELPRYRFLVSIASTWPLAPFLRLGYRIFAELRPLLPKKKQNCETSPFCELKEKQ